MSKVTFDCAISCTSDAHFWVDGEEVELDESGFTKSGKFDAQTGITVNLRAQIEGPKGSTWTLDITPECPGKQPQKLWSDHGTFAKGGVMRTVNKQVPDNPCALTDGLELSYEVTPERVVVPARARAKKVTKTENQSK